MGYLRPSTHYEARRDALNGNSPLLKKSPWTNEQRQVSQTKNISDPNISDPKNLFFGEATVTNEQAAGRAGAGAGYSIPEFGRSHGWIGPHDCTGG